MKIDKDKLRWALPALLVPSLAFAQQGVPDLFTENAAAIGEGWAGFLDFEFLINAFLTLLLATALGAVLAYHPRSLLTADTLEEVEARKVYMLYSVIGALIGMVVVEYGLVIGFILFGIGGLIRFRTILRSAVLTGQVIFVTLIGLTCGLDLPHVAVLATVFGFILIYVLDARIIYRADIRELPADRFADAAAAYAAALERLGFKIIRERKNPAKQRLTLIFIGGRSSSAKLEGEIEHSVDLNLRGTIDWELN